MRRRKSSHPLGAPSNARPRTTGECYQERLDKFVDAHVNLIVRGRYRPLADKTVAEFIEEHREELIEHIRGAGGRGAIDDEEISMWVSNDEFLYNWALREKVTDI